MAARAVRWIDGHLSTAQRWCKWPRTQSQSRSFNASPEVPCFADGALSEEQSSGTLYGVDRFSGSRVTERLIKRHLVTGGRSFMRGSSPQRESFVPIEKVLHFGGLGFKELQRSFRGSVSTQARYLTSGCVSQQQSLETHKRVQTDLQTDMEISASQVREMKLKSIDEARVRIFGHMVGNGERSGHKVLRQKLIGEKILAWYPTPIEKLDPMYEDPNIRRLLLKNERLKRRGKGPPKKGHGKRAAKRAK